MDRELREKIFERAGYLCRCGYRATEIHHIIANTKLNRKLYGDNIDSEKNLIAVCKDCHNKHSLWDMEKRKELERKFKNQIKE